MHISRRFEIPFWAILFFWGFGGIFLTENLASYSCLATPISYNGNEISRVGLSRIIFEIPILGYFRV